MDGRVSFVGVFVGSGGRRRTWEGDARRARPQTARRADFRRGDVGGAEGCCGHSSADSGLSAQERRSRYTIDSPPDVPGAVAAALAHVRQQHRFLARRPIASHTRDAFERVERRRKERADDLHGGIIIDAGCGSGMSTEHIARAHPDHLVVGIDRSDARLSRNDRRRRERHGNAVLVRAELVDFWRLAVEHHWRLAKHYILYPNPYPRRRQLKKRWHGHPCFGFILQLGGTLEVRTNWQGYLEEFEGACRALLGGDDEARRVLGLPTSSPGRTYRARMDSLSEDDARSPISLFERKYLLAQLECYRLHLRLR